MKVHRMKAVSMALAFSMTLGVCSFTAFADEPEELWVNGVNILVDDDKTVECGEGTAVYDEDTNTLTLDNATIDTAKNYTGIYDYRDDALNIMLTGRNAIISKNEAINYGISSSGKINISGSGELEINLDGDPKNYSIGGIGTSKDIKIKDAQISIGLAEYKQKSNGILTQGHLELLDCDISIDDFCTGINLPDSEINIDNSSLKISGAVIGISIGDGDSSVISDSKIEINCFRDSFTDEYDYTTTPLGIMDGKDLKIINSDISIDVDKNDSNAIYSDGVISIKDGSKLILESSWPALYAMGEISVNKSKVFATCDTGTAIYTENDMKIENGSEIKAKGYYRALQSVGSMTLSDSKINAVSTNDIAIWSLKQMELDGEVYAKGGVGYPAIAVRYQKADGDNEPEAKITLNKDYTEESGGKISASDWYENNGKTYSWTSFIAKNGDGKLATDFSNGLNEANIIKVKEVEKKSSGSSHSLEEKKGGNKERPAEEPADTNQESGPFSDVNKDTPNYDAIIKVYENGWMEGIGNGIFAPNGTLTRGMAAQILWNVAGKPESDGISPFLDVTADKYYARAVAWAYEHGIILGYDETTFGPEDYVTIEQFEIMMAKYKGMTPAPYTGASPNATRGYVAGAIVL